MTAEERARKLYRSLIGHMCTPELEEMDVAKLAKSLREAREEALEESDKLRTRLNETTRMMSEQARQRGFAEGRVEFLEKQLADAEEVLREIASGSGWAQDEEPGEVREARAYFERWKVK